MKIIQRRKRYVVNTDPMKRCYNGCHFSSELVWGKWEDLDVVRPPSDGEDRVAYWKDLNDYAVSQRGEEARNEYRVVEKDSFE